MKYTKALRIPAILFLGIFIGYIISNLFVFSDTIQEENIINKEKQSTNTPYEVFQPKIPEELTFCGEVVPLEYFDVYEALDFELIINTYRHSSTMLYIKRANRYFPEIEKMLAELGIPDDMKYLCVAESGLANAISNSGATGFWQFMKPTADEYGLTVNKNIDERYDNEKSLVSAAKYFKTAYKKFGNWTLAAASYNMGVGGLSKDIDHQRVSSYWDLELNQETARYIYRILALKLIISNPENYGFNISEDDLYKEINTYSIEVDTAINDLVQFAFDNEVNYKILKYFNPWLRGKELHNINKKTYKIILPEKGIRGCKVPQK